MLYLLYKLGELLALSLPVKLSYWLADALGSLYYYLARKDRKIVSGNIEVVLNHNNSTHRTACISRMVFVSFARYLVEFFRIPLVDSRYIAKNVRIEGRENLDRALNLGKGVILLGAHLGNWEWAATVLASLGYKINMVAWTHHDKKINDLFLRRRQGKGIKVIPLGIGIRRAFTALNNNEILGLLGDVDYTTPENGIKVKFFGQEAIIPRGPAAFSIKTSSPIIPTFLLREEGNKFKLILGEPIIHRPAGNRQDDLMLLTQKITQVLESYIARYPAQWFMLTPRWQKTKTTQQGAPH